MAKTRAEVVEELVRTNVLGASPTELEDVEGKPIRTIAAGGFEILPEEEESRPAPPARGKYPKLLESLLKAGLAPRKPAMSIRVPEGEEPLLVAEGLKREGRRVGQQKGMFWGEPSRWGQYYIEAWVHPTKEGVVQVKAREGVAPTRKKPKGEGA